jgi:hypothetical protein
MPTVRAASATAAAWLLELTAITPDGRGSRAICESTALNAPRTLKDPVTWKHSALRRRSGSRSVASVEVRRTYGRIRSAAFNTSTKWVSANPLMRPRSPARTA